MGIEPTRAAPLGLENEQFGAMTDPKCDGRVNSLGTWDNVRMRRSFVMSSCNALLCLLYCGAGYAYV
jgi:hypothetical protein